MCDAPLCNTFSKKQVGKKKTRLFKSMFYQTSKGEEEEAGILEEREVRRGKCHGVLRIESNLLHIK